MSYFVLFLLFAQGASSSSPPSTFWNETVVESRRLSPPSVEVGLLDVHIPKSGGTSMIALWEALSESRHYCASEIYAVSTPIHNIGKCDDAARLRLLSGHTSLNLQGAIDVLSVPRVLTVLILREPLARIVSFANFHNINLQRFEERMTFWVTHLGSNSMTKFVNGVKGTEPFTRHIQRIKGTCEHDEKDAIEMARDRLLNVVTVFGITEYFVESLWLFGKTFDWPQSMMTIPLEKTSAGFCGREVNQSECGKWRFSSSDLKEETWAFVRENERCDYKVYQSGLEIFLSRLDTASPEDKEDLEKFKSSVLSRKAERDRQRV